MYSRHDLHCVYIGALMLCVLGADNAFGVTPERVAGFHAGAASFSYSDALPIKTALNGLHGNAPGDGKLFVSHSRIDLGYTRDSWRFTGFWRYDYDATFNRDTIDLWHRKENDQAVQRGRNYVLDLDARHLKASGASVTRAFAFTDADLQIRFDALRAMELTDGRISGSLAVDGNGRVTGNAALDYAYTDDLVLNRPHQGNVTGWGLGMDLFGRVTLTARWSVAARVDDVLTWVRWDNAPYTRATLRLARPHLASDGTLDAQALLTGIESARTHWQRVPMRYDVVTAYQLTSTVSAYGRLRGFDAVVLPDFGLRWQPRAHMAVTIGWNVRARALSLGFSTAQGRLTIGSDRADFRRAQMLDLDFSAGTEMGDVRD